MPRLVLAASAAEGAKKIATARTAHETFALMLMPGSQGIQERQQIGAVLRAQGFEGQAASLRLAVVPFDRLQKRAGAAVMQVADALRRTLNRSGLDIGQVSKPP